MKTFVKFIVISTILSCLFFSCNPKSRNKLMKLNAPPIPIQSEIWVSTADTLVFPEDVLNLPKTGICMSGGGTRAMVCAIGQLKALREIGILDDVGYLSCVSGGSWASVPFTYYTKGAKNDDQLLGTIIAPEDLRISKMDCFTKGFLGAAANCNLLGEMLENLGNYNTDDIWIQGISECYMKPFGLYDQNDPKYFSYNPNTVANICNKNKGLLPSDFITVHDKPEDSKRPYLVVNSSISGPFNDAPFKAPEDLAVMNYTPLGVGSAVPNIGVYNPAESNFSVELPIGGGFIEPFAFGSPAPTAKPSNCNNSIHGGLCINTFAPQSPFPIANASGTSSAAFAAIVTSHSVDGYSLSDLTPRMNYWPVSSNTIPVATDFMFGDGGNLENLGAITLLQRKVYDLVIFVNTDTAIDTNYNKATDGFPTSSQVSSDILTLFGVKTPQSENMNKNQVFEQKEASDLMTKLVNAKKGGKSIIVKTSHTTKYNPWWGIQAGKSVNIVWVYNDKVDDYINALEWEIRDQIKYADGLPMFANFPLYKTVDEDLFRLVELSAEQINLLYQFSAWHVYNNKEYFTFLTDKK